MGIWASIQMAEQKQEATRLWFSEDEEGKKQRKKRQNWMPLGVLKSIRHWGAGSTQFLVTDTCVLIHQEAQRQRGLVQTVLQKPPGQPSEAETVLCCPPRLSLADLSSPYPHPQPMLREEEG